MIHLQKTEAYLVGLKRLHNQAPELDKEVEERIGWFVKKPKDERLANHPLGGDMTGLYAFSITDDIRITYQWLGKNRARLLAIGTHEEVYGI
jgi:mRNA-degrading endonuclease YafQ of YafQ-DinJ toxin-antitoxin module